MHHLARVLFLTVALAGPAWASGDFVILAREPDPDASSSFTATVWRLDEQTPEIVPVARLAKSRWSPTQLHPARPDLLRLQIPYPVVSRGSRVAFYHINRADWTVREVWWGIEAFSVFEYEGAVYIRTTQKWGKPLVDLRFPPGSAEPEALAEPFEHVCPVTNSDRHHIIRRNGVQYLYDAATGASRRVGHADLIEGHDAQPALSPDGSRLAYFVPGEAAAVIESGFGHFNFVPTRGTVVLLDLGTQEEHRLDIWVYTGFGSGRMVLAGGAPTFDEQGGMRFMAIPADRVPPGEGVQSTRDPTGLAEFRFDPRTSTVEPVPPAEVIKRAEHHADDGHDTAWAFLHAHWVEAPRPVAWMDTTVGLDRDGNRFLLKCVGIGLDDTFFLADIAADSLTRIPAPTALMRANAMNIIHFPDR